MKILSSQTELMDFLGTSGFEVYLSPKWEKPSPPEMVVDMVSMDFSSPVKGNLVVQGGYNPGEQYFIITISTLLKSGDDQNPVPRHITLIGEAATGIMVALFCWGDDDGGKPIPDINWADIQDKLAERGDKAVNQLQKDGFQAFSAGEVSIPDVLYLPFKDQGGDLHLKGAHRKGGDIFVLKIATGSPNNVDKGISTHQGVMLAFSALTGEPLMILKDEGHLTDLRTAIAGRNAADEMMPADELEAIGVLGTGVQARLQIKQLESLYPNCRKLTVWGRSADNTANYMKEMSDRGWHVTKANTPKDVADRSNLIITTTPSMEALLDADDITKANTLIIAIGADMPGKIELSPALLAKADCITIDSIVQGKDHGNAAGAIKSGAIDESHLQEFGDFLSHGYSNPDSVKGLRVFLSSGIGVQDLQIVEAVI